MRKFFKLLITLFFVICIQGNVFCNNKYIIEQYIKNYSSTMNFSENLIDTNYRLFVFGESHWWPVNYEIILFHLIHLYKKTNAKTVFIELPYFMGLYYNYLLENPQIKLDSFALVNEDYYMLRKDSRDIFQQYRIFYQILSDDQKFKFVGVNHMEITQIHHFYYALEMLLPDDVAPTRIKKDIETIRNINRNLLKRGYSAYIDTLYVNFRLNLDLYKDYLGNNFEDFENLLINGVESKKLWHVKYVRYCDYDESYINKREEFLYNNISRIIEKNNKEKFIALLGDFHTYLSPKEHWCGLLSKKKTYESATAKLNTKASSLVKNQVCVFRIFYFKSIINVDKTEKNLSRIIKRILPEGHIYTIKLDAQNSPFIDIAKNQYQYIIAVRKKI